MRHDIWGGSAEPSTVQVWFCLVTLVCLEPKVEQLRSANPLRTSFRHLSWILTQIRVWPQLLFLFCWGAFLVIEQANMVTGKCYCSGGRVESSPPCAIVSSLYLFHGAFQWIQDNDCLSRYWGQALRTTALYSPHYFLAIKAKGRLEETFPTIQSWPV